MVTNCWILGNLNLESSEPHIMKAYENRGRTSMKSIFNKSKDREKTLICKVYFFSMGLLKVYQSCFDTEKPKKATKLG